MTLPLGWKEATPGGLATCADPIYGGIVDSQIRAASVNGDGAWFAIFNDSELSPIEGLATRDAAFAAFFTALHEAIATRMAKCAALVGVASEAVTGCLFEKLVADGGNTDAAHSVARAKTRPLVNQPLAEQIKVALAAGVGVDRMVKSIWGEKATWSGVRASYDRSEQDIEAIWETAGFEVISTGGGFWAAAITLQGVNFFLTDYAESPAPNPDYVLHVGGHSAATGEYLDFSMEVDGLEDAMAKLPGWAESLQEALLKSANDERSEPKSSGPGV